jgi:hypothetical protein
MYKSIRGLDSAEELNKYTQSNGFVQIIPQLREEPSPVEKALEIMKSDVRLGLSEYQKRMAYGSRKEHEEFWGNSKYNINPLKLDK